MTDPSQRPPAAAPPARRARRWAVVALATLAVLAGALFLLALAYPPERLGALVAREVRAASGRAFEIDGPLSLRLWPRLAVVARQVSLGNAAWGSRPRMLQMREAAFEIALAPLLRGEIDIVNVRVLGADLLLETDASGRGNWVLDAAPPPAAGRPAGETPAARAFALRALRLADVRIGWRDGVTGRAESFDIATLDAASTPTGTQASADLAWRGQRWQVEGEVGPLRSLLRADGDYAFDLRLRTDGAALAAQGRIGLHDAVLRAELAGALDDAQALAPWLPRVPALPLPLSLQAGTVHDAQGWRFEPLSLTAAGQTLGGRVAVSAGAAPSIELQLRSASLDLRRLWPGAPAAAAAPPAASSGRLFDDVPLPFGWLPPWPVRLQLQADRLTMPDGLVLDALALRASADALQAQLQSLQAEVADGRLELRATLDAAAATGPPRLALRADLRALSVETLAGRGGTAGALRGGRASLRADLKAAGRSARELAAGVSGELLLTIDDTMLGPGAAWLGTDVLVNLLRLIDPRTAERATNRVRCIVVRLPLRAGVARIDRTLAVETDQLDIVASGELDLRQEQLQLVFRPRAKQGLGISVASLAQLVRLEGPLKQPRLQLDVAGTARGAASVGAAVVTGGLSLLGERLLRESADPEPCRRARGGR